MTHLTGFNYTEVNRRYVETLEIEDVIHKNVQLEKEFDAVILLKLVLCILRIIT